VIDRIGQVWEFDLTRIFDPENPHRVVYIVIQPSVRSETHETYDTPGSAHSFLNTENGTVSTWWELDALPYENFRDRRRLA